MSFYKFTTPAALAAWDEMDHAEKELRSKGKAFAESFGGNAVYKSDLSRLRFYGVSFPGEMYISAQLWIKPMSNTNYASWPRSKPPKGMQDEHKALCDLWKTHHPGNSVSRDEFFVSVGLDWGMLFLTGFQYFRLGDVIYFDTSSTPKADSGDVEILGSEYKDAVKALREAKS